jgi:hypothetical protein
MRLHNTTIFFVLAGALVALSACGGGNEIRPGVLVEYGNTTVDIQAADSVAPTRHASAYRPCTRTDVIELTVGLMCAYPEGPSDVERRAYLSTNLDKASIDPDSYDPLYRKTSLNLSFTEEVADGMMAQCPARLEQMLMAAN